MSELMEFVHSRVDADRLAAFVQATEANPLRANFGKWERFLTANEVRLVEGAAWDEMIDCGYQPKFQRQAISRFESYYWRLHNRSVQARRILTGALQINGGARPYFRPEREEYPLPDGTRW
jgi:hypothetical protein